MFLIHYTKQGEEFKNGLNFYVDIFKWGTTFKLTFFWRKEYNAIKIRLLFGNLGNGIYKFVPPGFWIYRKEDFLRVEKLKAA